MNIVSDTEKQDAVKDWNPNHLVMVGAPCSESLPGARHRGQTLWAGRQGNNALLYEFADCGKRTGIHDYIVLNKRKTYYIKMKLKMSKQYETSSLILFSCLLFQNSSSWCRKRVNERSSHELIVWALYLLEMQQVKRFNYAIDVNLVNFSWQF